MTGKLAVFGRKYSVRDNNDNEVIDYLDVWDNQFYTRYRYDKKGLKGTVNKVKDALGFGWLGCRQSTNSSWI